MTELERGTRVQLADGKDPDVVGTVIKTDRYYHGKQRAFVLWDEGEEDMGYGPGIMTYRFATLKVAEAE